MYELMIFSQGAETCYSEAGRRPPIEKQDGSTEYTVHSRHLKVSRDTLHNISVTVYGAEDEAETTRLTSQFSSRLCRLRN